MKLQNIKYLVVGAVLAGFVSCNDDDDLFIPAPEEQVEMEELNFEGTFAQEDQMGRAAINTVLNGDSAAKNSFNLTIPSEMVANFQQGFLDRAVALHAAFGVEYENNVLGLDATTLTTVLAADVLQVAPDAPTTYIDGAGNVLTGRNLTDDVVDVSLILLFGGNNGDRFNGQDLDNDGVADLPILVTDNVPNTGENPSTTFPYLEGPH